MKYLHPLCAALLFMLLFMANTPMNAQKNRDSGYVSISSGGKMYWESQGEGTPVILVHGHTLDRRMWRTQVECLSKHFRVVTPDMRGYGRSSKLNDSIHTTHVDDLLTLMDSLHIDKAHVVGLSMGGFITADMVAMYPERMLSCIMASGALRSRRGFSEPVDSTEYAEEEARVLSNLAKGIDACREEWIEQLVKGGGTKAENMRSELTAIIGDWDGWLLTHHEPHLYYARTALPVLKQRRPEVPALYMCGDKEKKRRPGMLDHLPNSRFIVIPDCGHMSNMEQPHIFNEIILNFLKK